MQSTIQRILTSKPTVAGFVALLLLIPLSLIESKVKERSFYRSTVVADISHSWAGAQTLMGPVVVLDYQTTIEEILWNEKADRFETSTRQENRTAIFPVAKLNVKAQINTQKRYRGIYGVPVYSTEIQIGGVFKPDEFEQLLSEPDFAGIQRAYLWINTSDQRGFLDIPTLNWGDTESLFIAGGHGSLSNRGIIAKLSPEALHTPARFNVELRLRGTQSLSFVPTGKATSLHLGSTWPHPKFTGSYLPLSRSVDDRGFTANWNITELASNITNSLAKCNLGHCEQLLGNQFGVSLIEPIDVYVMTERAVKYGLLYVVLIFALVLGSELYRTITIHPIQYLMVGVGVSVFYLLLLALSEHIAFSHAYSIATFMCSSLLTYYGVQIFRTLRGGITFGCIIAILYALLFVILNSEDIALLLGTLIIFIAVTALMITTRNAEKLADWLPAKQDQPQSS